MSSLIWQPNSRLGTKNLTLFLTSYFPYSCDSVKLCKVLTCEFQIFLVYSTLGKEPCSRLHYLYTCHFPSYYTRLLFPILNGNCLISIHYPGLNCLKAAHTCIIYISEYPQVLPMQSHNYSWPYANRAGRWLTLTLNIVALGSQGLSFYLVLRVNILTNSV